MNSELNELRRQRDELLAALERIADQEPNDFVGGKTVLRIVQDIARQAIEGVKS